MKESLENNEGGIAKKLVVVYSFSFLLYLIKLDGRYMVFILLYS